MNSSRNKKLLACFLTALGLSANSLDVSAKNSQFMSNARFALNEITNSKFFGGTKIKEKGCLDILASKSKEFYDKCKNRTFKKEDEVYDKFFLLCSELYSELEIEYRHRYEKGYNSLLYGSLGEILELYPCEYNNIEVNFENMHNWLLLLKVAGTKEEPGILKYGRFSVGGIIEGIVRNLYFSDIKDLAEKVEKDKKIEKGTKETHKERDKMLENYNVKEENEEVKQENKEEKINRIIKNRFKFNTKMNTREIVFNFKLTDDKFNAFKEKIEDVDLNSGIIAMQSELLDYQNLVSNLSEDDISLTEYGYISGYSFDNTEFVKYKLSQGYRGNPAMARVLVRELNQEVNNYNRGQKKMKFTVVNIDNENESFVNIEIVD